MGRKRWNGDVAETVEVGGPWDIVEKRDKLRSRNKRMQNRRKKEKIKWNNDTEKNKQKKVGRNSSILGVGKQKEGEKRKKITKIEIKSMKNLAIKWIIILANRKQIEYKNAI